MNHIGGGSKSMLLNFFVACKTQPYHGLQKVVNLMTVYSESFK